MVRRPFWLVAIGAIVLFTLVAAVTDAKPLAEGIRFLQISLALGVVVAYSGEAWKSSIRRQLSSDDFLTLGITLSWLSGALLGLWLLMWRLAGQPSWMVNSDFVNGLMTMSMFSAALHLMAPGAIGGVVPRKNMIRLGAVVCCACFVGIVVMTQTPRISMFVRMLRPFVEQQKNGYDAAGSHLLYVPRDPRDLVRPILWKVGGQ